jgi:hypothetical protein
MGPLLGPNVYLLILFADVSLPCSSWVRLGLKGDGAMAVAKPFKWRELTNRGASRGRERVPRWMRSAQGVVALAVTLVIFQLAPQIDAEAWRVARQPAHVYILPQSPLPADLPPVLMVAHNAGNNVSTTTRAIEFGASSIEIDINLIHDRLSAAHNTPGRVNGPLFIAPTLGEAWGWSSDAPYVKLDLKGLTAAGQLQLVSFLIEQEFPPHRLVIVSRSEPVLTKLDEQGVRARLFLSIGDRETLEQFLETNHSPVIDGVSVTASLLDVDTIFQLKARGLLVEAWTVNDPDQFVDLARAGVDAVSTDNLALIDAMQPIGIPVRWMSADDPSQSAVLRHGKPS